MAIVDLQGIGIIVARAKQYLAIQVDDSGKVTIDNDNLSNLLRINMAASNEKIVQNLVLLKNNRETLC